MGAPVVPYEHSSSKRPDHFQPPKSKKAVVAELKQKFAHLSKALSDVFDEIEKLNRPAELTPDEQVQLSVKRLRKIVTMRKHRNQILPEHQFADPAWDMLLDLTIAMAENRRISVSSLSLAANVPITTALRHIKQLSDEGVILIVSDPKDGRRKYTHLSESIYNKMIDFGIYTIDKY